MKENSNNFKKTIDILNGGGSLKNIFYKIKNLKYFKKGTGELD